MERSMEVDLEDVEAKQRRQLDFVPGTLFLWNVTQSDGET